MFTEVLPSKGNYLADINADGYLASSSETPTATKNFILPIFRLTSEGADGFIEHSDTATITTFISDFVEIFGISGSTNKFTTEWRLD